MNPMKFFDGTAYSLSDIEGRLVLLADGDEGEAAGGEGAAAGEGAEGAKGAEGEGGDGAAAGEGAKGEEGAAAGEGEAADWRAGIKDEALRKHADRFTSLEEMTRANVDARQKLSRAIIPPGKGAADEDVAAYRKAIGVPEAADGYEFPEIPKEAMTDEIVAERGRWAERFHNMNVPAETAKALATAVLEEQAAAFEAQKKADAKFAEESEAELKAEWGASFDANKAAGVSAIRAMADRAGVEPEDILNIETKEGKFLSDDPRMVKIFSTIGRELIAEGSIDPHISADAAAKIDDEISTLREKQSEASAKGDNRAANRFYQQEQALLEKRGKAQPIVGADGRAA
jgi:hypothetical protein